MVYGNIQMSAFLMVLYLYVAAKELFRDFGYASSTMEMVHTTLFLCDSEIFTRTQIASFAHSRLLVCL